MLNIFMGGIRFFILIIKKVLYRLPLAGIYQEKIKFFFI